MDTFLTMNMRTAQSVIFMLTDKFCKFVLGFYSIKYWMDLH